MLFPARVRLRMSDSSLGVIGRRGFRFLPKGCIPRTRGNRPIRGSLAPFACLSPVGGRTSGSTLWSRTSRCPSAAFASRKAARCRSAANSASIEVLDRPVTSAISRAVFPCSRRLKMRAFTSGVSFPGTAPLSVGPLSSSTRKTGSSPSALRILHKKSRSAGVKINLPNRPGEGAFSKEFHVSIPAFLRSHIENVPVALRATFRAPTTSACVPYLQLTHSKCVPRRLSGSR